MLVIDEVDKILDLGFKQTVDSIMEGLPRKMQTLLFSATVSRNIKELARLNLSKDHEYIQIHDFDKSEQPVTAETEEEKAESAVLKSITPTTLLHYYMQIDVHEKLDMLFSFLKSHAN